MFISKIASLKDALQRSQTDRMRHAGALAAEVLEFIEPFVKPGVSTGRLDELCHQFITQAQQAIPACLGYRGFPKSTCISVNEVVCHGIPGDRILAEGDIVNIDVTVLAHGVFGDTSKMFLMDPVRLADVLLCQVTQAALYAAIARVKPGLRLREIGVCIDALARSHGYGVVREFCGHFIGTQFHEPPNVLHVPAEDNGFTLEAGMTFTIEPMINLGSAGVRTMGDGWTVKTKDRSHSAQYEHTILVTQSGYEILTLRAEETIARCG